MCSTTGQLTSLAKTVFKAIVQAGCSHPARCVAPFRQEFPVCVHVMCAETVSLIYCSRRLLGDRLPRLTASQAKRLQDTLKTHSVRHGQEFVADVSQSPGWVRVGHGQSPTWARNSRMACLTQNKSNVSAARLLSPQVGLAPWLQVKMRTCVCKLQSGAY